MFTFNIELSLEFSRKNLSQNHPARRTIFDEILSFFLYSI